MDRGCDCGRHLSTSIAVCTTSAIIKAVNEPVADIKTYRSNLIQIFDYLKQTGAKIIWACSTPFLESVHNIVKPSRRYLADLKAYNRVAEDLARQYGFAINDLYSLMF